MFKNAIGLRAQDAPIHIELDGVSVSYGHGTSAVTVLGTTDLKIGKGEFIALVGPSGCGKSTILKLAGGILAPGTGTVSGNGRAIRESRLSIGMAFQNPTLLPWLTIRNNIALPLKIVPPFKNTWRKKRNGEYRERVEALLGQVGLHGKGDRYPWQLSGGMQQRASLCRALVHEPELLLLDEPFSALDQFTKEELWSVMQNLWMEKKPTVVLVTHDLREATYLANRICVMQIGPGRVVDERRIDFPRPRTIEMTFQNEFVEITQQLRQSIVSRRAENPDTCRAAPKLKVA